MSETKGTYHKVSRSIQSTLKQLHEERERIESAIAKLEGLLDNLGDSASEPFQRSRAGWSLEARAKAAERMRRHWAAWRQERQTNKAVGVNNVEN